MNNIALFGGSFDPPHIGHKAIVEALEKLDYIDKIIIMPTFLNPFKSKSHAPAELRLKWLQELFNNKSKVEISSYEIEKNRKVATIESVNFLLQKYQKVFLVIGADNLKKLHLWSNYTELNDKVTFIVATRDSIDIPKEFITLLIDEDISSTILRENIITSKVPTECQNEVVKYYKDINEKQN